MDFQTILALPMQANDVNAPTIGAYLGALLLKLWEEEHAFSSQRPFGNSGWKLDVYDALARGGEGDEWLNEVKSKKADAIIYAAIRGAFGMR